jgi:hypothetical protein
MEVLKRRSRLRAPLFAGLVFSIFFITANAALPQQAAPTPAAHQVGTIRAVNGNRITLATDSGDINVVVPEGARIVRVEPGQKDLKGATLLELKDLQVGDRILVRGQPSPDSRSFTATGIITMKHADLEAKRQQEREEWQRHGIGGLVSAVDPAERTVTIGLGSLAASTKIVVHILKDTIIRRYPPDSVKFDDAKLSTLDAIKPGDQLRARGARSADGKEFEAQEVVSGSFRNIAGTISSVDTASDTISVMDAITKHGVTVKITGESQARKLPPEMAQRIAMRVRAAAAGPTGAAGANAAGGSQAQTPPASGVARNPAMEGGRAPDFQQLLSRVPVATLADLQKGSAVMIVATEGSASGQVTAVTLLAGVEPILTASPREAQALMLSPWSFAGAEAGDEGNP